MDGDAPLRSVAEIFFDLIRMAGADHPNIGDPRACQRKNLVFQNGFSSDGDHWLEKRVAGNAFEAGSSPAGLDKGNHGRLFGVDDGGARVVELDRELYQIAQCFAHGFLLFVIGDIEEEETASACAEQLAA